MLRQSWGTMKVMVAAVLIHAAASVPIRVGGRTGSDEDVAASFDAVAHVDSSVLLSKPVSPGLCDDVKQYAGYFNVTTKSKNYFYWFFESRSAPSTDPVVMWMTGGPGCSSGIALFNENGPCAVKASGMDTRKNKFSWNSNASLLFIDQPAGTGFSYGDPDRDYDHSEKEVSRDMYNFLQAFYAAHPEYKQNPFHLFGESYGGHYVPATAGAILAGNKEGGRFVIPLTGVGVGNGLTAPEVQYGYYGAYAAENPVGPLVPSVVSSAMKLSSYICLKEIASCQKNPDSYVPSPEVVAAVSDADNATRAAALRWGLGHRLGEGDACDTAFVFCALSQVTPIQLTGINLYDVRQKCANPPLCYDFGLTHEFLNLPATQAQLGVKRPWESCNMAVNARFHSDWMHSFASNIPALLDSGVRVLVYAGEMDYICNYMGNKAWTLQLEWSGKAEFNAAGDHSWTVGGKPAGLARSANGFHFLQVFEAGHMVPLDQPANSLEMLNSFLNDTPFY